MATIITVSNQKGGVGKTTTSAALAAGIAATGKRVLGVDLDHREISAFAWGWSLPIRPRCWMLCRER